MTGLHQKGNESSSDHPFSGAKLLSVMLPWNKSWYSSNLSLQTHKKKTTQVLHTLQGVFGPWWRGKLAKLYVTHTHTHPQKKLTPTLPDTNVALEHWWLKRWISFWGPAYFQGQAVSFREGNLSWCPWPKNARQIFSVEFQQGQLSQFSV